ncbi:hypothetical protein RRG08_057764, partial [Elysia crispata]
MSAWSGLKSETHSNYWRNFCKSAAQVSDVSTDLCTLFTGLSGIVWTQLIQVHQTTPNPTRLHHNLADTCKQWLGELDNSGTKIYNPLTRTQNSSTMKAELCHGCRGKPLKETP